VTRFALCIPALEAPKVRARPKHALPIVAICLSGLGLLPAAAGAATVTSDGPTVRFSASPGESSDLVLMPWQEQTGVDPLTNFPTFEIRGLAVMDEAAPPSVGAGCGPDAETAAVANCASQPGATFVADLGDGNDRITQNVITGPDGRNVKEWRIEANGGRGVDTLFGSPSGDVFDVSGDPIKGAVGPRGVPVDGVRCHGGLDKVKADATDDVGKDCEQVTRVGKGAACYKKKHRGRPLTGTRLFNCIEKARGYGKRRSGGGGGRGGR
jgi:hypothetical protein